MGVNPSVTIGISDIRDGKARVAVMYRGRIAVPARVVGELLGNSDHGKTLLRVIRKDWSSEFQAGVHLDVLRGAALTEYRREAVAAGAAPVIEQTRALTVFYPKGIELITQKTGRQIPEQHEPPSTGDTIREPTKTLMMPETKPWWWDDVHRYLDRCVTAGVLTEAEALRRMSPLYQNVLGNPI